MKRQFVLYRRKFVFAAVGGVCFLVQLGLLAGLVRLGVPALPADAAGFLLSAQLNYLLSARFTWGDRGSRRGRATLLGYNATALLSLAVNAAVFAVAAPVTGAAVAAGLGVSAGMTVTYAVCDLLLFRGRGLRASRTPVAEGAAR